MKLSLINRVKYSPLIYNLYYHIGSLAVNTLKLFVKTNPKRLVFVAYGGRKYDDSPKGIYLEMINDPRFADYEFIWAFQNPEAFDIPKGRKIKTDTLEYFKTLLSARVWVTNSSVERGLHFSGKNTFYLNTWHGTPLKKMGTDIADSNMSFKGKGDDNHISAILAQGNYEADIFARVFRLPREKFKVIGYPRNDELISSNTSGNISAIKRKLGIPESKKVILYAPTFREYEKDENKNCIMKTPINLKKWEMELGNDYVFLLRAHYEVVKVMNVTDNDFVKNVSSYQNLNELMLISDMLISDYSSIFFDYSILGRPMIPYCYDYETYNTKRGLYFDIRHDLDCHCGTEDSVIDIIKNGDMEKLRHSAISFNHKYLDESGNASKLSVDLISEGII